MINLLTLLKNHFNNDEIADDNLKKFAEIHIERLTANNTSGDFTSIIDSITPVYNDFFSAISDESTKSAVKEGLTLKTYTILSDFKKAVARSEGLVRGTFGKASPQYQEFFPHLMKEYYHSNLANSEALMTRFIGAAEKYSAELGSDLAAKFNQILTEFKSAREAQLYKIGEVAELKTNSAEKRKLLVNELYKSFHTIAAMFPGNYERSMDFFDQSFLRIKQKKKAKAV